MKTFVEVQADAAGVVANFVVENEDPVMVGQPLFELARMAISRLQTAIP
jgi:biotin carboxyl carrier protein